MNCLGTPPRTWGCTCVTPPKRINENVFPTHVGVYLEEAFAHWAAECLNEFVSELEEAWVEAL